MEVWNIITFIKCNDGPHLDNVQSFVLLDIGTKQMEQYEKAKEAFIDAISNQYDGGEPFFSQAQKYIEEGVYEDESCVIYFKISDDVD